jgi:hypothetical protein
MRSPREAAFMAGRTDAVRDAEHHIFGAQLRKGGAFIFTEDFAPLVHHGGNDISAA